MKRQLLPDFSFEQQLWEKGFTVIGIDEVGRGCLAGPLVLGAVCFDQNGRKADRERIENLGINDSKKISEKKRSELSPLITRLSFATAIAQSEVLEINQKGIVTATQIAVRKVVKNIQEKIPNRRLFVLIDAFFIPYLRGIGSKNQQAIIHGDQTSISIAAASIIAKVYRDNFMTQLATKYPNYFFEENKGYGTRKHQNALLRYGPSTLHRTLFIRNILKNTSRKENVEHTVLFNE